jgi:hypothetical protein
MPSEAVADLWEIVSEPDVEVAQPPATVSVRVAVRLVAVDAMEPSDPKGGTAAEFLGGPH